MLLVLLLLIGGPIVIIGGFLLVAEICQRLEDRKYRRPTRPEKKMTRETATTVKLDLHRLPTLEELENFVEEARLAGVDSKAKVSVYSGGYDYNHVRLSVRQELDLG